MFAVYNRGSVQFRSSADNLYTLDKVDELAGSRLKPDDDLYVYFDDYLKKSKSQVKDAHTSKALDSYKKIAKMDNKEVVYHVEDIMTKDPFSINENATIKEGYELLREKRVSQIAVVTDSHQIIGMVNKKIILNRIMDDYDNGKLFLKERFKDVELPEFVATDPISDIRRVAKVMLKHRIDALPVVNSNDILVGIVSKTDMIKAFSHIPDLQLWA
jgi:CBS domain-containing protein